MFFELSEGGRAYSTFESFWDTFIPRHRIFVFRGLLKLYPKIRSMKRIVSISIFLAAASFLSAQADSVLTLDTNEVFYQLDVGNSTFVDNQSWDLALTVQPVDVSIQVNEGKGLELFKASDNFSDWATLDTSMMSWVNLYNSSEDWVDGAFNVAGSGHPDYGWGTYNMISHALSGTRLFILKLADGTYKKFKIEGMTVDGIYTFTHANLDGSAEVTQTLDKANYPGKDFVYYSVASNSIADLQPANDSWELVFTKYMAPIQAGPSISYYPVSGIKVNDGIEIAQREGIPSESDDMTNLTWSTSISEIGYDWKSFNRTTFQYDIQDSLAFFVKLTDGDVWKLVFTDYAGSGQGKYVFTKELVQGGSISVEDIKKESIRIYPNPSKGILRFSEPVSKLELFNISGQLVFSQEAIDAEADLSHISSGTYLARLYQESETQSIRLIFE